MQDKLEQPLRKVCTRVSVRACACVRECMRVLIGTRVGTRDREFQVLQLQVVT